MDDDMEHQLITFANFLTTPDKGTVDGNSQ